MPPRKRPAAAAGPASSPARKKAQAPSKEVPGGVDATSDAVALGRAAYAKGSKPSMGYGTAGFRTASEGLDHVLFRMGILAALRSKVLGGKAVGVMVTASHNPERDNGVKLVEPMGEMLPQEWEAHATKLANASDDSLMSAIQEVVAAVKANLNAPAEVFIGRDTRSSSPHLALAAVDGVGAMQPSQVRSLGLITTPQLHFALRCRETRGSYGRPSVQGYLDKLAGSYTAMLASFPPAASQSGQVVVDCANGVGAVAMGQLTDRLKAAGLDVVLSNTGAGELNGGCGADFVKLMQREPANTDTSAMRGCSLDGDADRLVYYFGGPGDGFRLLDGDRLALLFAHFIATTMQKGGLTGPRVGVVQTAYANGGSTAYAKRVLGADNVLCAKTGVKHCHHVALALDVGIYFEANGHGTVLFSDKFVKFAETQLRKASTEGRRAASQLLLFRDIINEAVGDAISGFLAAEAVLKMLNWSCNDWLAMYRDLPNRQTKVVVADRAAFETTNAERTCVKPEGLQAEVDKLVAASPSGRAFVRPSGTEDVVRVYAEADTLEATISLSQAVVDLVYERAGGVGEKPVVK